jgi:hypothetical protein
VSGPFRRHCGLALGALLVALIGILGAVAAGAGGSDARWIMERSNLAYYYAGVDARYRMALEMGFRQEPKRVRTMTVLRWSQAPGGEQKYLIYFQQPGDVRRMSCMTLKHVGAADERWMYVPAAGRVMQVVAPERSSFLGSEFVREEFSGRDVDADTHRFLRSERLRGRDCYVVESTPKEAEDFTRFTSWIDRVTFLPLRQEFWNSRGERSRVFVGERIAEIPSLAVWGRKYPTLMERSITNAAGRWTKVSLDSVQYDVGLHESDFSEEHLRTPMREWLP